MNAKVLYIVFLAVLGLAVASAVAQVMPAANSGCTQTIERTRTALIGGNWAVWMCNSTSSPKHNAMCNGFTHIATSIAQETLYSNGCPNAKVKVTCSNIQCTTDANNDVLANFTLTFKLHNVCPSCLPRPVPIQADVQGQRANDMCDRMLSNMLPSGLVEASAEAAAAAEDVEVETEDTAEVMASGNPGCKGTYEETFFTVRYYEAALAVCNSTASPKHNVLCNSEAQFSQGFGQIGLVTRGCPDARVKAYCANIRCYEEGATPVANMTLQLKAYNLCPACMPQNQNNPPCVGCRQGNGRQGQRSNDNNICSMLTLDS